MSTPGVRLQIEVQKALAGKAELPGQTALIG